MIYWKEECQKLAEVHAKVVVVDSYDASGVPVFATRIVIGAMGSRNGRNSYWSVMLNEPLSDECTGVAYSFIMAINGGEKMKHSRLTQYHPAWTLSETGEQILEARKYVAMVAIGHNPGDTSFVGFLRVSREECERVRQGYLNSI